MVRRILILPTKYYGGGIEFLEVLMDSVDQFLLAGHANPSQHGARDFQERLIAMLASYFGGLALLLVCVAVYGIMSYSVVRRTGEIGIRVALGAQPRMVAGKC